MNYQELNKEAIEAFYNKSTDPVWLWSATYRGWFKADYYDGHDRLHVVSKEKPNWSGSLLTLNQALIILEVNPELELWYLQNTVWWRVTKDNLHESFGVYLTLPKGITPEFNPMQREIGKLMYEEFIKKGKEKIMQETTTIKPTPHKHCKHIVAWAKDTSQPVWVWNSITESWLIDSTMEWLASRYYAVGEMPLHKPTKTVRIEITRDYTVTGRTFDVPYDATEESILAEGYKSAQEGVRVSYSILKE